MGWERVYRVDWTRVREADMNIYIKIKNIGVYGGGLATPTFKLEIFDDGGPSVLANLEGLEIITGAIA